MDDNFEHEYTTIQGVEFIGDFSVSKEEFIQHDKGRKIIQAMLEKISINDIFSNGKKIGDYLDTKIKGIILKLCNMSNNVQEYENNVYLYNHEISTTYHTQYDGYKILSGLEDYNDILGYDTPYFVLNVVDNFKKHIPTIQHINPKLVEQLKESKYIQNINDFAENYDYKIEKTIADFPTIEYLIALVSLGDQVSILINDNGIIQFSSHEYIMKKLHGGLVVHGLDTIFDFLLVDDLRDDVELISNIFNKSTASKTGLVMESFQKDMQQCVMNVSNGKMITDIQEGQIRSMEYQFKSNNPSIDNFKRLSKFVDGQGSIGYEYHRGVKKNILGSKKHNYKRQAKYIDIANQSK